MLNNFSFTVVLAILWSIFSWKNDTFAFEIQDSNLTTSQVAAVTQIRAVGLQTVGSVIVWNQAGDPGDMYNDGGMPVWLECDGSLFDTGYYTALAGIIPSGVLPNLKDQFLRGGTSGQVGQTAQDSTREHYHGQPQHTHSVGTSLTSTAVTGSAAAQIISDNHTGIFSSGPGPEVKPVYGMDGSEVADHGTHYHYLLYGTPYYFRLDQTVHSTQGPSSVSANVVSGSATGIAIASGGDNTYKNSNSDGTTGGTETAPKHIRVRYLIRALP